MSQSLASGRSWSVGTGGVFTFFGLEGLVVDKNWVFNSDVEVEPTPVSDEILETIKADVAAGKVAQVAYVGVSPAIALCLALEGVISPENLLQSEETPDSITLDIVLRDAPQRLVIMREPTVGIATYNSQNQIV